MHGLDLLECGEGAVSFATLLAAGFHEFADVVIR